MLRSTFQIGSVLATVAVAVIAGGCAAPVERRASDHRTIGGEGGSWSLVFNAPSIEQSLASADARLFDEYSRNDARMNVRDDRPLTTRDQWPERARASLAYPRRIWIDTRPNVVQIYDDGWRVPPHAYPPRSTWYWGY